MSRVLIADETIATQDENGFVRYHRSGTVILEDRETGERERISVELDEQGQIRCCAVAAL